MIIKRQSAIYILIYYFIALLLKYYLTIEKPDFYSNSNEYLQGLMSGISPLIAGLVMVYLFKRSNNLTIFSIGIWKTFVLVLIPIILFTLVGFFNIGIFYSSAPFFIGHALIYAILEEYGWRGYLQTELNGLNKSLKYFIISILWYIWHLDLGLDYNHLLSYFFVLIGSIGIGFIADKSKSLIITALFHAFFNLLYLDRLVGLTMTQKIVIIFISSSAIIYTTSKYNSTNTTSKSLKSVE